MYKNIINSLSFIAKHPISSQHKFVAFARYFNWQLKSRLHQEVQFDWINSSKLIVRRGMTGATGNIYCGLHEFYDMSFLLHVLRPDDVFVDVGSNIGSYTILASKVIGADVIAVEPDQIAIGHLYRNVIENSVIDKVTIVQSAVGNCDGTALFTQGLDTTNHILTVRSENSTEVRLSTLDRILRDTMPNLIKIDVEGHEASVLKGASETLLKPSLRALIVEGYDPKVASILNEAGFDSIDYDPFSRDAREETPNVGKAGNQIYLRKTVSPDLMKSAPKFEIYGVTI